VDNAVYYTLSTVSQTLAGALGLLAAFLILRLSGIVRQLDEHFAALQYDDVPEWHEARFRSDYAMLLKLALTHKSKLTPNGRQYHLPMAQELTKRKEEITASLKYYLWVTAGVIFVSVFGLGWAAEIKGLGVWAKVLLAGEAIAVLYCLQGYVRLIMKALP
jgi:hypothetical protein